VSSPDSPLSVTTVVPRGGTVGGLVAQQLPGLFLFAPQLGVGQAEPGDGAVGGTDEHELDAPVVAAVRGLMP